MATVNKIWTFDTTTENFIVTEQGGTGTGSLAWDANSYLKYTYTNSPAAVEDFNVEIALNAEVSWETLGVPAGGTVTSIELGNINIGTDGANPGGDVDLDTASLDIVVTDGANTVATVLTGYFLPVIDNSTYFYDTLYGTGSGGSQSVGGSYQSSTTTVNIRLKFNYITLGVNPSNLVNIIDDIELNINYDPPASATKYYFIT